LSVPGKRHIIFLGRAEYVRKSVCIMQRPFFIFC
jgi:hypothetical protein